MTSRDDTTEAAAPRRRPVWPRLLAPLLAAAGGILAGALGDNPIGWAVVAACVLLLVIGTLGRRVVGVLVVLVAAAATWVSASADPVEVAGVVGGVLAVLGGVGIALTAGHWPGRRSRFERGGRAVSAEAAPLEVWKAMDEGYDPTDVDVPRSRDE